MKGERAKDQLAAGDSAGIAAPESPPRDSLQEINSRKIQALLFRLRTQYNKNKARRGCQ